MDEHTPSPCNKACKLNADRVCTGCGRTQQEIRGWKHATPEVKGTIVTQAAQRLAEMKHETHPPNSPGGQ
jgi:predicted Fe-S protein YdhL (DUF1289 family)